MKKTIISLATASLIASSAMAANKGIDFTTTGQAVVYYQTAAQGDNQDLFSQAQSAANFGVQLNNNADLGNGFNLGTQLSYLGTTGLEKKLVSTVVQQQNGGTNGDLSLTKVYLTKKVANTTVKIGRQELPKSLSPLAFSEGWNVFKNTLNAAVVINTDVPNTTLVGALVGSGDSSKNIGTMVNLAGDSIVGNAAVNGAAYMLTAVNSSLPMTTLTGSLYSLRGVAVAETVTALWLDAKVADKSLPMGLKVGVQYGSLSTEADLDTTSAFGLKASVKPMPALTVCGAFSTVNDGAVKVTNTATQVKTPLYTQMVSNQGAIKHDNSTFMLKGVYSLGEAGTVIAQTSITTDNSTAKDDTTELDVIYKTKLAGATVLAAYVYQSTENNDDALNIVRVWARYAF